MVTQLPHSDNIHTQHREIRGVVLNLVDLGRVVWFGFGFDFGLCFVCFLETGFNYLALAVLKLYRDQASLHSAFASQELGGTTQEDLSFITQHLPLSPDIF